MEQKQPKTTPIKERLQQYAEMCRDFENQHERYIRLVASLESPKVQSFDAMPGGSPSGDALANKVALKIELEEELKSDKEALDAERRELEKIIRKLKKADERAVVRMKYFDGMDWVDICHTLYHKQKDYKRMTRQYMDKSYKLHGAALINLAMALEREKANKL